jgi:predicted DNA-binding WGR domain protein
MRIYMQTPPMDGRAPRFFQIQIQQDLIDGWTLIRESGTQGSRNSSLKKIHYECREDAEQALFTLRDLQLRKGFKTTFATGMLPSDS